MPYDNPNQNGNDYVPPTTDTGAGQSGGVNSDLVANLWFGPGGVSDLNSTTGNKAGGNTGNTGGQFGARGEQRSDKSATLTDGFLNFGDAFASLAGDQNKDKSKGEGDDSSKDSADSPDNDSFFEKAMKEIDSLVDKGLDFLNDGLDSIKDGLDALSGDEMLSALFGEDESSLNSDSDRDDDQDGDNGDAGQVESSALTASAMAAQAAASGDLNTANSVDLGAILAQLQGEVGEALADGNIALASQLSYAQSYVTDAMSKKDQANQVAANTVAAGGDLSALSDIMAGVSGGDTTGSAINKFNPQLSGTA